MLNKMFKKIDNPLRVVRVERVEDDYVWVYENGIQEPIEINKFLLYFEEVSED